MANEAPSLVQHLSRLALRGKEGADAGKTSFQWNIPRSSSGSFIGRTDALNDIQTKFSESNIESQKRYVITGIGGMGKSEICLRVIDKMRNQ